MSDVPIPTEEEGWHAANAEILELALTLMVVHQGGQIRLPASAAAKMTDGTLAFAFSGPEGENLDLAWVRHDAPAALVNGALPIDPIIDPAEQERENIKMGLAIMVIEAGGRLRIPPFDPEKIPVGTLAFGTDPVTGGLLYTFVSMKD